jgi:hypothetical protein
MEAPPGQDTHNHDVQIRTVVCTVNVLLGRRKRHFIVVAQENSRTNAGQLTVPYPQTVQQAVPPCTPRGKIIERVKQYGQNEDYAQRIYAVQLFQKSDHPSKNRKYLDIKAAV